VSDTTAETDAFAGMQAAHPLARAEMEDRERTVRRGIGIGAVILVHILIVLLITVSNRIPLIQRIRETVPEAITWIPMPPRPKQQEQPPPRPEVESVPQYTAPITLPPEPHRQSAPPVQGDMAGVGRDLACGASSYENLSQAQRDACHHHPWIAKKRSDGTIVLDVPPKPVEPAPSIADIMRHEQQTAPPCPVLQNVPCLGTVVHGDPLGGQPRPF
jgi:hypothetical protein